MSKTISDIASVIDCLHATPEYSSSGYPMVRVENVKNDFINLSECYLVDEATCDYHNKNYTPKRDDIIITRVGSFGLIALVDTDDKFCLGQNIAIISPYQNGKFLYYYLQSPYIQKFIHGNSGGSSYKSLSLEHIKRLPLVIDGLKISKIESILYNIDTKIHNNNAICADLEGMAKLLYDYWFVQFDFPDENGKPYKSSGGKMVWNEELKREIPYGWEVNSLSEICDLSNGINYDKNEPGNKEYKIVNVRNITASSLLLNEEDFDRITLKSSLGDKYLIHDNDILIARSGTPGAIRLLEKVNDNTIYCGFIIRCSLYDKALRNYICYYLKMFEGTNATKTGGSILQNVSQETLNMIKIPMPKSDLIASFNKSTAPIIKNMQNSINENQELASLRDFLLPMLMNGQVKVKKEDGNE